MAFAFRTKIENLLGRTTNVRKTTRSLIARSVSERSSHLRRVAMFECLEPRNLLSTVMVTSLADTVADDGQVTLREAIIAANTDTSVDGSNAGDGEDQIIFDEALAGGTITLGGTALPAITDALDITGLLGDDMITVDADGLSRIFEIQTDITVTISSMLLTNGHSGDGNGGAIFNEGDLTIDSSTVSNSVTLGDEPGEGGGGIYNNGTLVLTTATLSGNTAVNGLGNGGAIFNDADGSVTITGGTLSGNSAARAGGAIENNGGQLVTNLATFDNNDAGINGGAVHTSADGTVSITGGFVTDNTASGDDADQGGGAVFNDGGSVSISNAELSRNTADGTSGSGGGILNNTGGTLTVTGTTISGNTSVRAGGGIEDNAGDSVLLTEVSLLNNTTGSAPGNGGGLHITGAGDVTLIRSTVANNTANEGGGLWNSAVGSLTLTNSTVSGNTTTTTTGGGIHNDGGAVTLDSVTIADNNASLDGGGVSNTDGGTVTAINTIIATNTADGTGADVNGSLDSDGFNLIGDTDGATITGVTGSNILDTDPMLGALADNGGPTMTHLPLDFSPVIDNGADTGLAVDQRNVARPIGDAFDIGSVESESDPAGVFEERMPDDRGRFTFIDADGDEVTISLKGAGTFVVRVPQGSDPTNVNADAIAVIVEGTDDSSRLQIKTKGSGDTNIDQIIVDGDLRQVDGKTTNLLNELTTGAVQSVRLADVVDATITIGDGLPDDDVSLRFERVRDSSIDSQLRIKSLQVVDWQDTDDVDDMVSAPILEKLQTKGDNGEDIAGDFEANLVLAGDATDDDVLDNARIKGDVTGVTWDITGHTDKVRVDGDVDDLTLMGIGNASRLQFGDVTSAVIDLTGHLDRLDVTRYVAGSIEVNSLGKLQAKGDNGDDIEGDFGADVTVVGNALEDDAVDNVKIRGSLIDSDWIVDGTVNKFDVMSIDAASIVNVTGSFDRFKAGEDVAGTLIASQFDRLDVGNDVTGQLVAMTFDRINIRSNLDNGLIYAGANFGDDGVLGGGDDTFGTGSIERLDVRGSVTNSDVLVGLDPVDGVLFNGDDVLLGGTASYVDRLTVRGTVSADSNFVAGQFPDTVSIDGDKIDPADDPRFSTSPITV